MTVVLASPTVEWRRLSPRMLLVHPVIEVGKALPAIIGAFLAGHSTGGADGSRWSLAIAALVVVFAELRWFTTRYRINGEQVQLRHGVLRRKTVATPRDRVRTVDVTSHLMHRLLRLARVVIGTGTSDRSGRDRLVLDGLSVSAAAALRADLLHRDDPVVDLADAITLAPSQPAEEELARVEAAWLRYAPFTLTGAVTGLAVLGVAWRVINEGRVNLRTITPYRVVAHQFERWPVGLDVGIVVVAVLLFIVLASTAGYILSFWHFRLTRHSGGTLHISRGLLTSRATSIERRRLRGAELSEPLLLRWIGGARCLAIATGLRVGRGSERGGEILLPPGPRAEALRVAAMVVGSDAPLAAALPRHPVAARRRRIVRALAGAAAIVAGVGGVVWLAGWPAWLVYPTLIPVVAAVPLGLDRYRSLGHGMVDGFVVTSLGSIVRRRCVIDTQGVIGWNIRTSFFQRRQGLISLVATTAAGRQKYYFGDMARADAIRFADTAVPGLLDEFLASPS